MSASDRRLRGILLDIEGTTSSIAFVHEVMFPYVLQHLETYLAHEFDAPQVQAACAQIARDAGQADLESWARASGQSLRATIAAEVRRLMAGDAKATGLKALQGLIWQQGFDSGQLQADVFPDVLPAIAAWRQQGLDVRIYSSGSIAAQRLFFGHVRGAGDCLSLFSGHYDTTSGGKKESDSYRRIAADWGLDPSEILFISDVADELLAARAAGCRVLVSVRPGNAALPPDLDIPQIDSFAAVDTGQPSGTRPLAGGSGGTPGEGR